MTPLLAVLLMLPTVEAGATACQICPQCRTCHNCPTGWLWCDQHGTRAYTPREGDLVFLSRAAPLRTMAYWAFRTGHPLHVGIIVRRSDGCLALFETGGGRSKLTLLQSIRPRFAEQTSHLGGKILIRPVSRPLSYEESTRLTCFAESQVGKPLVPNRRYLWLIIPGRPAAHSHSQQDDWFCSELVVQSLREAGIMRTDLSSASIVPADLCYDKRVNLSARWAPPKQWMSDIAPMR